MLIPTIPRRACWAGGEQAGKGGWNKGGYIELINISKHFGAIQAVNDVSVTLEPGEVVGLMGDNGAGKSTLVKMIAGNFRPTHGTMRMEGKELVLHRPVEARQHGIEIVHQDLALCNNLTAAANVFLGRELRRGFGPFRFSITQKCTGAPANLHRIEIGDPPTRPYQANVGWTAPGGRHRPDYAFRRKDRSDGRADGGDLRSPGGGNSEPIRHLSDRVLRSC